MLFDAFVICCDDIDGKIDKLMPSFDLEGFILILANKTYLVYF